MTERPLALPLVLDTNIVLDLLVFGDAAARPLHAGLSAGRLQWLATPAMRDEFERVLGRAVIAARLAANGTAPADLLAAFDRTSRCVAPAAKAPVTCRDADDQKFIDLAVHHQCLLLSKDAAVLALRKRLAPLRVSVVSALAPVSSYSLIQA